jgi:predicted HicB family RNase H-like nuclease
MTKMKAIGADLVATKARPAAPSPEPEAPARKVYVLGEPMNFRVSKEFKRAFKSAAANHDLKMNELLVEAFDVWLREKGG